MAPQTAPAGTLSPDGVWVWDGRQWVPAKPVWGRTYRPFTTGPLLLAVALVLAGVNQLFELGALAMRLDIVNRLSSRTPPTLAEAGRSDDLVRAAVFIRMGLTAACAILFVSWLYRVVANNHALGARALKFGPGGGVGWWFVPIANYWMPFRVVAESWRAADPQQPHSTPDQRTARPLPGVLIAWWSFWILGNLIGIIGRLSNRSAGADLDRWRRETVMEMTASAMLAVAAVLAIMVVIRLSNRQRALHAVVSRPAGAA